MLISDTQVICTPKKTASTSLKGEYRHTHVFMSPQHGRQWPDDGRDRVLIVRHPLARLQSMWAFALTCYVTPNKHCWSATVTAEGPDAWLDYFFENRDSQNARVRDWVLSCAEYADEFKPDEVWRLEDMEINARRNVSAPAASVNTQDPRVVEWAERDLEYWYS